MSPSCYCTDYYSSADAAVVYQESLPAAHREYRCCECGEAIPVGERYHRATGLWEGRWDHIKTCLPCYRIRSHYCWSFRFGDLRATLWDCLGLDYISGQQR